MNIVSYTLKYSFELSYWPFSSVRNKLAVYMQLQQSNEEGSHEQQQQQQQCSGVVDTQEDANGNLQYFLGEATPKSLVKI